jgi:alkylated DNA repair protein (DNA oxidative demethylase)
MIDGFRLMPEYFSPADQKRLLDEVLARVEEAPLFQPVMPRSGKPMSVKMTNLGPLGWVSAIEGYRYDPRHPVTGRAWPAIPGMLLDLWRAVSGYDAEPQACLVNRYVDTSRLGLHIDADETAKDAPVVSVSLGDRALFRLGGLERSSPTSSLRLASGDVVVLSGASRRAYHGVDRIYPGTSRLVPGGGRINLTLRRVYREEA